MLFVSCQAEKGNPFNDLSSVVKFARCAELGGASGIRSEGLKRTKAIKETINLPVIGLVKRKFRNGYVAITIRERDFLELLEIGSDIIAVDGTPRMREGMGGPEFIRYLKSKYFCKIMADISTVDEGIACAVAGADYISTTLNGYTPWTINDNNGKPNEELVCELLVNLPGIPVVAEGRIFNTSQAKKFISMGCEFVVVGSAITRPHIATQLFVNELK